MTNKNIYKDLKQLGSVSKLPDSPETAILEKVENPHKGKNYIVRFTCPEFTSLCPLTSQPDFANFVIDYIPHNWIVESKSLKLYMNSFRNHASFHEDCSISIAQKLIDLLSPKWFRIGAFWFPRGGIPIDVFYETGDLPKNIKVPDFGIKTYFPRSG